jgi:hypothetical protein
MEDLNVVIHGNGLNKNGLACFNLTLSSLKGEALHVFNDKAVEQKEETKDTHVKCLRAITEHVFPKDNPPHKQKTFMRNHVFLHLSDRTISEFCATKDNPLHKQKTFMCNHVFLHLSDWTINEFCARWIKLNNYLDEFLPFKPNQRFTEDQTKDILYNIIPKRWQSYLQHDKFDINQCSVKDFFDMMECYQLANNLDPSLKPQNQSKTDKDKSNKSTEKSNDKKRKAKSKKNDSDAPAPKKTCMIHGPESSHMTDKCQVVQEQVYRMKEAWKNISPAEAECSHQEREQQKQKEQDELHEMVMKQARQTMKDMFKQPHQHHHLDNDSNIDEAHHIEEMENITVSECFNLSDLRQPPTKKTKTQHFAPITTALLEMHLGKSSIHKLRVLFDSGSSGSIIVAKFVKKTTYSK